MLKMDLEFSKGILFARLCGMLDRTTTYKINNYLIPAIIKHNIQYLVFNLYDLNEIDEWGMDAILNTKSAIDQNKGIFYVCEIGKPISKKLRKVHVNKCDNELVAERLIEI